MRPADESASCWWVANAAETDKTVTAKLKCRSLASLRLELAASRVANTSKLRKEWERRVHDNQTAVERLRSNPLLWRHVSGPDPEKLLRPSEADLAAAQRAGAALKRMVESRETGHDQLHVVAFAEDLVEAVEQLKTITWDAIRRERFSLTPEALFDELARTAASLLTRVDDEAIRRQTYLAKSAEDAGAKDLPASGPLQKDKWVDLEQFKQKSGKPPQNWNKTVQQANAIIVDDMRTKLELHYDDVHLKRWRQKHADSEKRAPGRRGAYRIFASVEQAHRRSLNQDVALPTSVTCILQCPEDETSWKKLDSLRRAVCALAEGECEVFFRDKEEIGAVAAAIEACKSQENADEVGKGSKLPTGSRVKTDIGRREKDVGRRRELVAASV